MTATSKRIILAGGLALVAVLLLCVYTLFDPASGFFPVCPVKYATGFDCPGCGSQRAIHALLNGHFVEALKFNALAVVLIPFIVLLLVLQFLPSKGRNLNRRLTAYPLIVGLMAIIAVWTVVRNIPGLLPTQ